LAPKLIDAGCDSYFDYYQRVKYENGELAQGLIDAVVNNETFFFRELAQLEAIADLAESSPGLRILSAACSSGEEPYSVAMLLDERGALDRCEIVAVDVSVKALERAQRGLFGQHSFRGLDGRYLDAHFTAEGSSLRLSSRYVDAVRFERVNLLDPPGQSSMGAFDIVLCRNVLIYFDLARKCTVIDHLMNRLSRDGLLFLGHSESLYGIRGDIPVERPSGALAYRAPGPARVADRGQSVLPQARPSTKATCHE